MRKLFDIIALTVTVIGALNWGLIGFFDFNLVEVIFGNGGIAPIIYGLVGLGGIYLLSFYGKTGDVQV